MNGRTQIYRLLLRLCPPVLHEDFGEEMTAVFMQARSDARQRGRPALPPWYGREFASMIGALAYERWLSWRPERPAMNPMTPAHHRQFAARGKAEPPLAILAGVLPFLLFGLMFILKGINYHTTLAWMGHGIAGYLIVHLVLIIGLGVGWALRFPRWSYSYLGVVLMNSVWLAGVVTRGFHLFGFEFGSQQWGWRGWMPLLMLAVVMLLATRSLQPLKQLIQGIRHDWTQLSFALYAALSWLFLGVAYDGKTWYNETLYLPVALSLLTLAITSGAYFYMRGQRPWPRVLALQVAFLLQVPISELVIALDGPSELGPPATIAGRWLLLFMWFLWASVPLIPGLASLMLGRFRAI